MLTKQQFIYLTTKKSFSAVNDAVHYETKTSICKYGQCYNKNNKVDFDGYINFYYQMYVEQHQSKIKNNISFTFTLKKLHPQEITEIQKRVKDLQKQIEKEYNIIGSDNIRVIIT